MHTSVITIRNLFVHLYTNYVKGGKNAWNESQIEIDIKDKHLQIFIKIFRYRVCLLFKYLNV